MNSNKRLQFYGVGVLWKGKDWGEAEGEGLEGFGRPRDGKGYEEVAGLGMGSKGELREGYE